MGGLKIIKAEPNDSREIHDLIKGVLDNFGLHHLRPAGVDDDIDDMDRAYFADGGFFWIGKDPDGLTAASIAIFKLGPKECELRKMYVRTDLQGKGYGKLLLKVAIEKARQLGYEAVSLKTNSNLHSAIALYKKSGFDFTLTEIPEQKADCDIAMKLTLKAS